MILFTIFQAFVASPILGQELRLEITGRRNPLKQDLFPIVFGKIENQSITIFEKSFEFSSEGSNQPGNRGRPVSTDPSALESGGGDSTSKHASSAAAGVIPAATFVIKNIEESSCITSKKTTEILFLVNLLKSEISRISLSSSDKNDCYEFFRKKLAEFKPVGIDEDPLSGKIRIRLHFFAQTSSTAYDTNKTSRSDGSGEKIGGGTLGSMGGEKLSGGSLMNPVAKPTEEPDNTKPQLAGSESISTDAVTLTINGEDVEIHNDGWFVYEPASTDAVMILVRKGSQVRFLRSSAPELMKTGITERKSTAYRYAYLISNAAKPFALLTTERLDFKSVVDVSLPFYLKTSYGNTRLFPLPGEGQIDRPTLIAGVKTHPIAYGMHFEAEGFFSAKSQSQIPWTSLLTAVIGSEFLEIGNNISLPWGLGVRGFKSKIDNGKAAADSGGPTNGRIIIPESVLGPAILLGAKYRNNYIFTDLMLTITPLQIPGSDFIVTYNPSFYLGYQMTGADSVTINYQTHDVRFPTTTKIVKVTASIVAIGYMRDLQ